MKKPGLINLLLFIVLMNSMISCKQTVENIDLVLSDDQKSVITKEIMDVTNNWVINNVNMKPEAIVEFWDNSPDLAFAENGEFFTNIDSIRSFLKSFYSNTDKMEVEWLERSIIPIKTDVATLSGKFRFKANFKSGNVFEGKNAFTAVFVKKEGKWVVVNGHESKIVNN